jgi:flagellar biogenesis protein FliO
VKIPRIKILFAAAALSVCCAAGSIAQPSVAPQRPAAAQFKSEEPDAIGLAVRVVGGLITAALLAFGVIYGLKRFAPWIAVPQAEPGKRSVRIVETLRLTQKLSLFVVEFGADRILLACSERGVTVVSNAALGELSKRRSENP